MFLPGPVRRFQSFQTAVTTVYITNILHLLNDLSYIHRVSIRDRSLCNNNGKYTDCASIKPNRENSRND